MCLSVFPTVALADGISFTDVKTSDWFYNDVKIAVETGLVNGKSATIYAPEDNLTYAEAVKLAACMHQLYSTGSVTLKNGTPWYQSFVDYCKLNGIISDDYQWSANINRAGYMDIFSRALPDTALAAINMVADGSVPDVPMTHKNAASIYKLYRAGIVQGVDAAHNCNPNSNIKRSEVAAILTRMMNVDKRLSFSIGEPIIDKPEKELKITQQPEDAKGKAGQTISFEVKAEGDGLIYQWQRKEGSEFKDLNDTSSISGSTYNKITVILPSDISGFSFRCRCVVSDKNGKSITSNEAILDVITEVIKELKITQQPEDTKGKAGETVSFEVKAEGDGLTYQWQKKEGSEFKDLNDTSSIIGSASNKINVTLPSDVSGFSFRCRCVVSDKNGKSVTSNEANLEISTGSDIIWPIQPIGTGLPINLKPKYVQSIFFIANSLKKELEEEADDLEKDGVTVIRTDLNSGAGGDYIYLCYRQTTDPDDAITDLFIANFTTKPISIPVFPFKLNHYGESMWSRISTDLNQGAGGDYLYLYTTTDSGKNRHPIYDLKVYIGKNPGADNPGWEIVKYRDSSANADLNKGAEGDYIYLLMKRKYD